MWALDQVMLALGQVTWALGCEMLALGQVIMALGRVIWALGQCQPTNGCMRQLDGLGSIRGSVFEDINRCNRL